MADESGSENEDVVILERDGPVAVLTLNRPKQANALNLKLIHAITKAVDSIRDDASVGCLIIQGNGRHFCSGGDLTERVTFSAEQLTQFRYDILRMLERIESLPIPVIASCHGAVAAGGLEIALACDIRVGAEESRWGVTEVRKAGAFPAPLAIVRLERLLGSGKARWLVFRGHLIEGPEALELGLVDRLVEGRDCSAVSRSMAEEIVEGSWDGLVAAKQLMRVSWEMSLRGVTELSTALMDNLEYGPDRPEAFRAWGEKREPAFRKSRRITSANPASPD